MIELKLRILAIPLAFTLILTVTSFMYLFMTRQVPVEQRLFHSHIWDIVESNIAYAASSLLGGISKGLQPFLVISTAIAIASISE